MTVAPVLDRALRFPSIDREHLYWQTLDIGIVEISIELVNHSDEPTTADMLIIEAAPLGAFVPNLPLTRVAVGSLDPGERRSVSVFVSRDALDEVSRPRRAHAEDFIPNKVAALLDESKATHWIGNLNVYFESDPGLCVERHRVIDIKVPAGSQLASLFVLGEESILETICPNPTWKARAEVLTGNTALLIVDTPSESGETAEIQVNAIRRSDRATVPIEFQFETVEGWGEAVGCVRV